jgi:hypothetical protein
MCELLTSVLVSAEAYGPVPSSDGNPSMPSTPTPGAPGGSGSRPPLDGGPACASTAQPSLTASRPPWMGAWIASQRGFLAAIFQPLDEGQGLEAHPPAPPTPDACEQLTLGGLGGSSSKIRRKSGRAGEAKSLPILWRGNIAGETEALPRLTLEPATSGSVGSCLRTLPTLTASEMQGSRTLPPGTTLTGMDPNGKKRQVGLRNALRLLPTLCATDFKSPYSAEGFRRQTELRSKPLRDTAAHTIGIRLTPTFAEWWMGWPLGSTAAFERTGSSKAGRVATRGAASKPSAMHGSRSRRRRPGSSSVDHEQG